MSFPLPWRGDIVVIIIIYNIKNRDHLCHIVLFIVIADIENI